MPVGLDLEMGFLRKQFELHEVIEVGPGLEGLRGSLSCAQSLPQASLEVRVEVEQSPRLCNRHSRVHPKLSGPGDLMKGDPTVPGEQLGPLIKSHCIETLPTRPTVHSPKACLSHPG